MSDNDFKPNKSSWESKRLDKKSILLLRNILEDARVDDSTLEEGGTESNTDGYISILDDDTIVAKVTVQIKHHNNKKKSAKGVYYDLPVSILAYAHRMKGEVVMFITCDTDNNIAYWKYIDDAFIESFKNQSECTQQTYRYYFKSNETLSLENVDSIIDLWETLYRERTSSLKDEKKALLDFININLKSFRGISTTFYGLKDSHIVRKETEQLFDWIQRDLTSKEHRLKLLVGNAGTGKTVIIKDLIDKLRSVGINCLAIKADYYNVAENETSDYSLARLHSSLDLLVSEHKRAVLIVDQIDALSQYLSNDRNKLNNLLNVIASWGKEYGKDVRIIVSCREYDLEYDPSLSQLKEAKSSIEVDNLTEKDVESIVNQLAPDLYGTLSPQTVNILRTPQYLDIFCRLHYSGRVGRSNYENYMELYDDLWSFLINYADEHPYCGNLEHVTFEIAKTIQKTETLTPTWLVNSANNKATKFLASQNIVRYDNKRITFFHQSFYDYALARYYVSNNKSFIKEIKHKFQGLELRSSIKIFLDFERTHSDTLYKEDLNTIIFSSDVRLHLKQLALSLISYTESIQKFEIDIVKRLPEVNYKLFLYFLSTTNSPLWFPTIKKLVEPMVPKVTSQSDYIGALRILFANYAFNFPDDVYCMMDTIKDSSIKEEMKIWVLRHHNDYNNERVRNSFYSVRQQLNVFLMSCIIDSINTNLNFALDETKKTLIGYFLSDKKHNRYDDYELFEGICSKLNKEHPREFLPVAFDCFVQVVSETKKKSYQQYYVNSVFRSGMSDYTEKFFDELGSLLIQYTGDDDFGTAMVERLLSLDEESAFILSFKVIAAKPILFDHYIKHIVSHNHELDKFIQFGDVHYYFLEALSQWYLSIPYKEQIRYQEYVLKFRSKIDKLHIKDRECDKVYPYCGWHKWQLLCSTILDSTLTKEAKRCKQELCRRFNHEYINVKPDHHVIAGSIYGGITTQERYNHLSAKNWLSSFTKLDENKSFRRGKFSLISIDEHAKAFTQCVENSPAKYKNLVFALYDNPNIKTIYQEAGLKGLFLGGIDPNELVPLFQRYMTMEYIRNNAYTFEQLAMNYTKAENYVIDDLVPILVEAIKQPLLMDDEQEKEQFKNFDDIVQRKLRVAINSFQGHALNILISICALPTRRTQIYNILNSIHDDLALELRLEVLFYIYYSDYYDEGLMNALYPLYLSGSEAYGLMVRKDVVQSYYYFKTDKVSSYITGLIADKRCHETLAQIFFYGLQFDHIRNICKQNLNEIISLNDEKVIATMVRVSLEHISESCYKEVASDIILQHKEDRRNEVIQSYKYHIDNLPIEEFNLFKEITKNWSCEMYNEGFSLINYMEKCVGIIPLECYRYIKEHNFLNSDGFYNENEIVKILLGIYKRIKEEENLDAMNELMDLFDEYVIVNSFIVNDAIEKLGV